MPSIVVIGAGPGGEAAARRAAQKGAQVTVVERREPGGLCLNRGCIPSKTLLEAGRLLHQARAAAPYLGGAEGLNVFWDRLQRRKETVVRSLREALDRDLQRLGIRVIRGQARFRDGRAVRVRTEEGEETLPFDAAVLATGSAPFFPEPFPALAGQILDSDQALALSHVPARLLIVGGGAVGCEFACLFHELGARVTLVEKTPGLLPGEDPAVVRALQTSFEKRGIRVTAGVTVEEASRENGRWTCRLSDGSSVEAEEVLVCVGRRPILDGLGLAEAGIASERGRVAVNEFLQTANPRIYAVGDVNGLSLLAHAASAQGETAADHALGGVRPYRNDLVPRCLYTWPEVASVGEWIHSAAAKGLETKSQRFFFQGSPKAIASGETEGFIQAVSDKKDGRLLGAQIVGPHATELIHVFSVALQAGFSAESLREVIYAHPTLSEGIKGALSR